MQEYIGYIRVSTPRQGEGVSLEVQSDAISTYAERNNLNVGLWLDEKETAGKRGRPVFNQAMKLLGQRRYRGIILHKLDRGARNLKDWSDIGELVDQGIEVHFVNESLDLQTRGGRLSADIQAVVAADFIRNQKEETRKGLYGRLKQGLYPWRAPLGYADNGKGRVKTIHPIMGPLVKKAFELYGTANYSFETLGTELYRLGLRNRNGSRVTRNGLSTIFNNTFYFGIIHIQKTNQSFSGNHAPLITKSLFDRVKNVLTGKFNGRTQRHAFLFRRMLSCGVCGYSLVGERQKGHVYYRCHGEHLPRASIREEVVENQFIQLLQAIGFSDEEKAYFQSRILKLRESWKTHREIEIRNVRLQLDHLKDRRNRLTDAYLDQILDKTTFEERKNALLLEEKALQESLGRLAQNGNESDKIQKFLELAGNALLSYQKGISEEKREMVSIITSNRSVKEKTPYLKPSIAFQEIANRFENACCDPERSIPRTWNRLLDVLSSLNNSGQLPDLPGLYYSQAENIGDYPRAS
jgi:site-specific DNA recombinase